MNGRTFVAIAVVVIWALPLEAAAAYAPRVHIVQRLMLHHQSVQTATGATITFGTTVRHTLQVGEIIYDGTRIDVPLDLTVTIVSSGDRSTTTLDGGASVTFVSTGSGELLSSNKGTSRFNVVPHTLDFFRVQSGEALTASVHGTEFSVDVADHGVTYNCTRGEVNVTKTGYLSIGRRRLKTSLIDVVSAANRPRATYHSTLDWNLATFANFAQAEAFYQQQLAAAERSGDANAVNVARLNLGNVERLRERYAEAQHWFSLARTYYRNGRDHDREATALEGIGLTQYDEGFYDDALADYRQALKLFDEIGDGDGRADVVHNIGLVEFHQSHYSEAIASQEAALAHYRRTGNVDGEAWAFVYLGEVEDARAQYGQAQQTLSKALSASVSATDRDAQAAALQRIGALEADQDENAAALVSYLHAISIYRDLHDGERQGYALMDVGMVQESEGRYDAAARTLHQSIDLLGPVLGAGGEASPVMELGSIEEEQGKYGDALRDFNYALAYFKRAKLRDGQAGVSVEIALVKADLDEYAEALRLLWPSLATFRKLGRLEGQAQTLDAIGLVETDQHRYSEALTAYREAYDLYIQLGAQSTATARMRTIEKLQSQVETTSSPAP